jgi:hypothetical protein
MTIFFLGQLSDWPYFRLQLHPWPHFLRFARLTLIFQIEVCGRTASVRETILTARILFGWHQTLWCLIVQRDRHNIVYNTEIDRITGFYINPSLSYKMKSLITAEANKFDNLKVQLEWWSKIQSPLTTMSTEHLTEIGVLPRTPCWRSAVQSHWLQGSHVMF